MSKPKTNNLELALLAILAATVFAPTLIHAKDYAVGVKAGDWIKYGQITITWTGNGTEPSYITDAKKLDWVRIDVLSVEDTTASMNVTAHYNNGTQTTDSFDADVQSSNTGGMYLLASNLTAGDPLTPQIPATTINQTVTRMYAGANRNVNIIDAESSYTGYPSQYKIYWDQNTGIMVEQYTNQTELTNPSSYEEVSLIATETNLWSANTLDLIQNNLIYIIAGTAATIVVVAVAIVLRRRKPSFAQQPIPPPTSTPPPPPP